MASKRLGADHNGAGSPEVDGSMQLPTPATPQEIVERLNDRADLLEHAKELALINMRFEAALSNMSQGLCMFDGHKRLIIANKAFKEMYNLREDQILPGTSAHDMLKYWATGAEDLGADVNERVNFHAAQRSQIYRLVDGRIVSIKRTPTADGGWVATHDDITERERFTHQINHLAFHDPLTGLANRAGFARRGAEALRMAARGGNKASVLLVDLDRFKDINDRYGHAAGDRLLQLASERIRRSACADDIVARLGGDEFAILQSSETDPSRAAAELGSRLVEAMRAPFDLSGQQGTVGASVGIAIMERGDSLEQILRKADLALYEVKTSGRNSCRFYQEIMGVRATERQNIEADLREAISTGQMELHYQPIVSLGDGRLCGMEALARWRHPTRGLLTPDHFIPLAEETGLIVALSEFVVRRACADASNWPEHVNVAINVSPSHLKIGSLKKTVSRALSETRISPGRLEVEVTETVLFRENEDVLEELQELRRLGIAIALDDFGTGFSSLSHLRMFAFDKIKIDRSFISEIASRSDSATIVSAISGLARSLDIATTAEGIETSEQLEILKATGCTHGQGYLFGRPCSVSNIQARYFAGAPARQSA